jgi:chromosome segregation ATPase
MFITSLIVYIYIDNRASQKMKFHESSNSTQQQYDIQLQDQLKENQSVIINLQSEIRLLTLNLQDKSNEYNNVKNELLVSESMITQLQTKLTNHESKIVILNNQLNNTNISNNQFMNEINAYKSKLENMNNLLNNEINKYNNIYIEKENLLKKYNHMELLLSNYENNNKDNNNKLRDLYDQISDQNDKLESYERDINTFVKDIANKDQQIEVYYAYKLYYYINVSITILLS